MLKSLILENVRGKSGAYEFGRITKLLGRNEAGKSTIKEAICFIFAGTDSSGAQAPVHLITNGTDGLKVQLTTEKVTLSRTLTRKKSQSLSMVREGVRVPLSQSQLSELLGASPDLFLSVFLPGYFMRLPEDKRRAVLAEVMPPIDRLALLQELVGGPISADELVGIDLKRRPDLAATAVAQRRRAATQQAAQLEGQISSYSLMAAADLGLPPEMPAGLEQRLAQLSHLKEAWADYRHRASAFEKAKLAQAQTSARNEAIAAETAALLKEIKSIVDVPVPEVSPNLTKEINELRARIKPMPAKPASMNLPGTDRCPTCGQTVGSKHREKVHADNEALKADYERLLNETVEFNKQTEAFIAALQQTLDAAVADREIALSRNSKQALKRSQLDAKAKAMAWVDLPALPPVPTPPSEQYNPEEERQLRADAVAFHTEKGRYDGALIQKHKAQELLVSLKEQVAPLANAISRYEAIEAAILRIPQEELGRQAAALAIDGYTFSLEGTSVARADGMPYSMLSTGAGMRADMMLSLKLNSLAKRPPGVVFLDNADLIDSLPGAADSVQLFFALVRTELSELKVEAL